MNFDPRITPARPDLAGKFLEGKVNAARFVEGEEREVIDAQAPVRAEPAPDAPLVTEALMGERVTIYDFNDEGWAWGQLETDHYVGFIPAGALRDPGPAATHKVAVLRTLVFPGPSGKLPPLLRFARDEATPERTALVRFRGLLAARGLDRSLFEAIARDLESKGACVNCAVHRCGHLLCSAGPAPISSRELGRAVRGRSADSGRW